MPSRKNIRMPRMIPFSARCFLLAVLALSTTVFLPQLLLKKTKKFICQF
jgi:hypothetical protein